MPQGTDFGPLLFICHINDLPERVNSQIRLFADDCLMYRTINSPQDHQTLQRDPFSLQIWADDWGMKFIAKKCYLLSNFKGSKTKTYEISSTGSEICRTEQKFCLDLNITSASSQQYIIYKSSILCMHLKCY